MLFDCWLCSDLCTSSFSLLIWLSSFHTNGHRGGESRLHLTTAHKAGSLEPTGGTEITLTQPEPKEKPTYSRTYYSKQKQEDPHCFPPSSVACVSSAHCCLPVFHEGCLPPTPPSRGQSTGTLRGHYWADDVKQPVGDGRA